MTLEELNCKFLKAPILMGIGAAMGAALAKAHGLGDPLTTGLLSGLLFSMHAYHKCFIVLIAECKRLKAKEKNEK